MADYQQRADAPAIGKQAVEQGAGHTPGPWTVHSDGFVESPDRTIACVYTKSDGPVIAAAPEMLEALIGVSVFAEMQIDDLCADIQEGAETNYVWKMEMRRWEAVLSAIRKATGAA